MSLRLSSNVEVYLDWTETSVDDISLQQDLGEEDELANWTYGSGDGPETNDAFYASRNLLSGQTATFNFTALVRKMLNMTLTRPWTKLKVLAIENTSSTDPLMVGNSGLTNPLGIMSYVQEIGPSGVYSMTSEIGLTIDSTHKNLRIHNLSNNPARFRLLAMGVR